MNRLAKLPILVFLCVALSPNLGWGQTVQEEVFNPPTSSTSNGWSDLFQVVLPHAQGISALLPWGSVDNGMDAPCVESKCKWDVIDMEFMSYIYGQSYSGTLPPVCINGGGGLCSYAPHKKLNFIVVLVTESQNQTSNGIPKYVFDPTHYSNWCPTCNPQDVATCTDWGGDSGVPTGGQDGVWNATACILTGASVGSCNSNPPYTDFSGYPVLYESPIMTAYQDFAQTLLKHYSASGFKYGPYIAPYIGYVRFGLASGGENLPSCTVAKNNQGIWPSQGGLSGGTSDWYTTLNTAGCGTQANPFPKGNYPLSCVGKDAYLENHNGFDAPGYVNTMLEYYKGLVAGTGIPVMFNTHNGPPASGDPIYADAEALLVHGLGSQFGFGMEALSVGDTYNAPNSCTDDWCYNFNKYGGVYNYLQSVWPNSAPAYAITRIVTGVDKNGNPIATVYCAVDCTSNPGQFGGIFVGEWIYINGDAGIGTNVPGTNGYYQVTGASTLDDSVTFSITNCNNNGGEACSSGTGGTLFSGDFLPNTIKTAVTNGASILEVYFCDWVYAFDNTAVNGCPAGGNNGTYSTDYANILKMP